MRDTAKNAHRQRYAKDLQVMVVNPVAKSRLAGLIQTLELVEADGVTVRHDEPVKENGQTLLAERFDFLGFSEHFRASRNKDLLTVVRIDVRRHKTIDRPGKRSIQAVDEQCFKDRAFEDHVSFPGERVEGSGPRRVRA